MAEYIEREEVEKFIEKGLNNPDKLKAYGFDAVEILSEVHFMPAADVAEVKHGWWKPFYESEVSGFNPEFAGRDYIAGYECSKCGAEAILDCNDQFVLSKCCPNCGARMDGEG